MNHPVIYCSPCSTQLRGLGAFEMQTLLAYQGPMSRSVLMHVFCDRCSTHRLVLAALHHSGRHFAGGPGASDYVPAGMTLASYREETIRQIIEQVGILRAINAVMGTQATPELAAALQSLALPAPIGENVS